MNRLLKILLYVFYVLCATIVMFGFFLSMAMKMYNNALLIVASVGVFILGLSLRKYNKK